MTADKKTLSTFTLARWNFIGYAGNGTNNIWRMCADGADYPHLNWESTAGNLVCPDGVN